MSRMGLWTQIPDESWVKVWVEAIDDDAVPAFTAQGLIHKDSGGSDGQMADLHRNPSRRILKAPTNYTVRVTIDYARRSQAVVVAEVTDSNRDPVQEMFSSQEQYRSAPIVANAGSSKSVTLFLVTNTGLGGGIV